MRFCHLCGERAPSDQSRFCPSCGAPLTDPGRVVDSATHPRPLSPETPESKDGPDQTTSAVEVGFWTDLASGMKKHPNWTAVAGVIAFVLLLLLVQGLRAGSGARTSPADSKADQFSKQLSEAQARWNSLPSLQRTNECLKWDMLTQSEFLDQNGVRYADRALIAELMNRNC